MNDAAADVADRLALALAARRDLDLLHAVLGRDVDRRPTTCGCSARRAISEPDAL